jgi:hypothetical protein
LNPLGDEFAHIFKSKYGSIDYEFGISSASTDFVSSCLPIVNIMLNVLKGNITYGNADPPGFLIVLAKFVVA